jgi:hypothetical protein
VAVTRDVAQAVTGKAPFVTEKQVLAAVMAGQSTQQLPSNVKPSLANTGDEAAPGDGEEICGAAVKNAAGVPAWGFGQCLYGDPKGSKLMVIYGDSHAGMWGAALESIAMRTGWRLETFDLPGCPAPDLSFISFQTNNPNTQCTEFHKIAIPAIRALHPNLVVVTSESTQEVTRGVYATPTQWRQGLTKTLKSLQSPSTKLVVIGDIPEWTNDYATCLAAHESSIGSCAVPVADALSPNLGAEQQAASASGAEYIRTTPWICGQKCLPVIANTRVYRDEYHLTETYVLYLSGALQEALNLTTLKS